MKRAFACLLVLTLLLSMTACSEQQINERRAIQAYRRAHPNIETVHLRHYYGEYTDGSVVVMIGSGAYLDVFGGESVADCEFYYCDSCTISVLRDGELKSLGEAYELGWLTAEDVAQICSRHREFYPGLYD